MQRNSATLDAKGNFVFKRKRSPKFASSNEKRGFNKTHLHKAVQNAKRDAELRKYPFSDVSGVPLSTEQIRRNYTVMKSHRNKFILTAKNPERKWKDQKAGIVRSVNLG
jgi:hypothetical protein